MKFIIYTVSITIISLSGIYKINEMRFRNNPDLLEKLKKQNDMNSVKKMLDR